VPSTPVRITAKVPFSFHRDFWYNPKMKIREKLKEEKASKLKPFALQLARQNEDQKMYVLRELKINE
jgi:hypothetical protein